MNTYSLAQNRQSSFARDALVVLGASLLIGLFGRISLPLPFTPVPIATQAQVILLLAALLGSKRGSLATLFFLLQGALGLPVFALGKMGPAVFLGPTGGYLLGYLFAAFATGWIIEKAKKHTLSRNLIAFAVGNLLIFLFGFLHLSHFIGFKLSLYLGVLPFLLTDFLKLLFAVKVFEMFRKRAS